MTSLKDWDVVIGLEIHVQLNTHTKLFSPAPNTFGENPNQNISTICTGQPGSLPLLNEAAVEKAVQFGLAVNADISRQSSFDRKSYFYPDSPRNFQITQFFHPIVKNGYVEISLEDSVKKVEITAAHLEDDAGTLKHFSSFTGVDDNRAGAPLMEIISAPCLKSASEAALYAKEIKSIFQYIGASDANMDQGQLRMDANISVRPQGETTLRNKVEIKNINSFHFLELAINQEISRQIAIYEKDPHAVIASSTCRFDPVQKTLTVMRKKESAEDYRYMPEPDIPPLMIEEELIERLTCSLPELRRARKNRYKEQLQLSKDAAEILTEEKALADYFEEALSFCPSSLSANLLANWITIEFFGRAKEAGKHFLSTSIPEKHIGSLITLIEDKTITSRIAKSIADEMMKKPHTSPQTIVQENPDYLPMSDPAIIEPIVEKILQDHPQSIEGFKNGKQKAISFLVGQVMKSTKGKASPEVVNTLLHKKLDSNR